MKRYELAGAAVLAAVAMSGCSGVASRVHKGQVGEVIDQTPERGGYFEAIGIGASDPETETATQRKALSRDAAIVKAQYELLSLIKGVTLQGGVTVSQAMEEDSKLEAKVNAMLRGAEVRKTEFTSDGGCVVTMRLPKSRLDAEVGGRF
jgi:hypothetical protein